MELVHDWHLVLKGPHFLLSSSQHPAWWVSPQTYLLCSVTVSKEVKRVTIAVPVLVTCSAVIRSCVPNELIILGCPGFFCLIRQGIYLPSSWSLQPALNPQVLEDHEDYRVCFLSILQYLSRLSLRNTDKNSSRLFKCYFSILSLSQIMFLSPSKTIALGSWSHIIVFMKTVARDFSYNFVPLSITVLWFE